MNISVLSNINMDSLIRRLSKTQNIYKPVGYGNWVFHITESDSKLYAFNPEVIFIILDCEEFMGSQSEFKKAEELLYQNIDYIESAVVNNPQRCFFVGNLDFPIRKIQNIKTSRQERLIENVWYQKLVELNRKHENFYIFDLKRLIEEMGREDFYSQKLWYLGGIKYSMKAEKLLETTITDILKAISGGRKKCLIVDLDNTLWGGIVGEVGSEGISLSGVGEGARYRDFQKRIKEIKDLGVLLAVVSKNNFADAFEVLRGHPDMYLREDDFAVIKINWNTKTINIKELAAQLNLGLCDMVFLDDDIVERESVKSQLPDVAVPDFPEDSADLERFIDNLYTKYFLSLKVSDEDIRKTQMYKQEAQRKAVLAHSPNYHHFLKNLHMKIKVWKATNEDAYRVSQLTMKTNQFNLTAKRYSEYDIRNLMVAQDFAVFVFSCEDRLGDNGIISAVIVRKNADATAEIDTFLISCRVIGRYLEDIIISFIEEYLTHEECTVFYAYYKPTEKNQVAKDLFEGLGYSLVEQDDQGIKKYLLNLNANSDIKPTRKTFGELTICNSIKK